MLPLRPDMTEKLLTGTLNLNKTKSCCFYIRCVICEAILIFGKALIIVTIPELVYKCSCIIDIHCHMIFKSDLDKTYTFFLIKHTLSF